MHYNLFPIVTSLKKIVTKLLVLILLQCNLFQNAISHKKQEMCDKTVGTYPSAMQFVPECYKSQETGNV